MSAVSGFYAFAKGVLTPIMTPWVKFTVTGEENLPTEGLARINTITAIHLLQFPA